MNNKMDRYLKVVMVICVIAITTFTKTSFAEEAEWLLKLEKNLVVMIDDVAAMKHQYPNSRVQHNYLTEDLEVILDSVRACITRERQRPRELSHLLNGTY